MKGLRTALPWIALALVFAGVAAGIHNAFEKTYQRGQKAGADSVQQRWAEHRAQSASQEAALQANYRAREHNLITLLGERTAEHLKELARVQREKNDFTAGVRAGRIRLSIPVTSAPACNPHHGAATADPAPAGPPAETRAELAPAAAESLVAIVDDGDHAIRDLNTCIDLYHLTRRALNHVQSP